MSVCNLADQVRLIIYLRHFGGPLNASFLTDQSSLKSSSRLLIICSNYGLQEEQIKSNSFFSPIKTWGLIMRPVLTRVKTKAWTLHLLRSGFSDPLSLTVMAAFCSIHHNRKKAFCFQHKKTFNTFFTIFGLSCNHISDINISVHWWRHLANLKRRGRFISSYWPENSQRNNCEVKRSLSCMWWYRSAYLFAVEALLSDMIFDFGLHKHSKHQKLNGLYSGK